MGLISRIRGRKTALTNQADKRSAESEPDLTRHWLCGDWMHHRRGVYYFYKNEYVDYKVGDTLSLGVKKGRYPIYKVTAIHHYPGSDPAPFDDRREYDLKFIRWATKPRIPTERMMAR